MQRDVKLLLLDIDLAAADIQRFAEGISEEEYESDSMVRAAVERKFTVIGEALVRIGRIAPALLERVDEARDIIGFRHVLTHGYEAVDDSSVWGTIQQDLPHLRATVQQLLVELGDHQPST